MTCLCSGFVPSDKMFSYVRVAPALHRLDDQRLRLTPGSHPREPGPAPTARCAARPATAPSPVGQAEMVLGSFKQALARMEEAPHPDEPENRGRVASRRLSPVLEVALRS